MSVARTARRRRKQMAQNNNHLSGMGVSRYKVMDSDALEARRHAQSARLARKVAKWRATGSNLGGAQK